MKKLLSVLLLLAATITASAQITWNAKAGLGMSSLMGDGDVDSKIVGKIGVGIEKPISPNWSLMPSLEFALKGAKYGEAGYSENVSLYYVQIPVLAAYRFHLTGKWNLCLKAGPYFAYGIAGDSSYEEDGKGSGSDDVFGVEIGAKRFEMGLDFGVDFEYGKWVVGAEYEYGITPLIDFPEDFDEYGSYEYKLKNQAFYVTVGYKF